MPTVIDENAHQVSEAETKAIMLLNKLSKDYSLVLCRTYRGGEDLLRRSIKLKNARVKTFDRLRQIQLSIKDWGYKWEFKWKVQFITESAKGVPSGV